ncbi:MFS transporter [Sulfobacillus harzensis]|uniref:MFS transporter n=1 Tax=Sulfobacillus harzensis TaxID=2729629 RepID=A0A7Y0Q1V2_9FIRM|nr:MFS transporter [Sulfobacillus harzensis]NMP21725.1 MFS transporter [Sulfobacillus harzensis]
MLGQPRFIIFWSGRLVSGLGDSVFALVTMWDVLKTTNSPLLAAIVPLIPTMTFLLFSLPLATLADRWPKKRVLIMTDTVRSLVMLVLVGLLESRVANPTLLYLFNFLVMVGQLLFNPAQQSALPGILGVPDRDIPLATGMLSATASMVRLVGYGVGGALVAAFGSATLVLVDAVSFALSAASLGLIRISEADWGAPRPGKSSGQFWRQSLRGLGFLWNNPLLRALVLIGLVVNLASAPLQFFTAVFSKAVLHRGAAGFGDLEATAALGALLASLVAGRYAKALPLRVWMVLSFLITGLGLTAMALHPILWLATLLFGVAMGSMALFNVPFAAQLMRATPDDVRGRVMAGVGMTFSVSVPVGLVAGGWLTEVVGARAMFGGIGLFLAMASVSSRFLPGGRRALTAEAAGARGSGEIR